jgi:anti-sigma-K factor RskA
MKHLSEEQLILHYYGEEGDGEAAEALAVELHLEECGDCRGLYGSVQRVLNVMDSVPVPDRPADYGAQVWQRLAPRLPSARRQWWSWPSPWRFAAAAGVCAALMIAAFVAGRTYTNSRPGQTLAVSDPHGSDSRSSDSRSSDSLAGERILRAAVGDYLDRSQMVLTELANANPDRALDISDERERAGDLVTETRLYRQTAEHTGDTRIAAVLDELERVLVDIAHAPPQLSPVQLSELRQRLDSDGLLFKIRVLGSNVRRQDSAAGQKL